jgi:hypothetical protein
MATYPLVGALAFQQRRGVRQQGFMCLAGQLSLEDLLGQQARVSASL